MVAVLYDAVTGRWFVGHTGTGNKSQGDIPAAIWNRIPDELNIPHYKFGRTCAEVHCLRQAYAARVGGNKARELENSVFAAYSPLEGRLRPPCGSCTAWIAASGGKAVR